MNDTSAHVTHGTGDEARLVELLARSAAELEREADLVEAMLERSPATWVDMHGARLVELLAVPTTGAPTLACP